MKKKTNSTGRELTKGSTPYRWCLSDGTKIYWETLGPVQDDAWDFELVASHMEPSWRVDYWHRWDASIADAKRHGWRFVKIKLIPVKS